MPDASFLVDRGHIDRFARALRQAVYDKTLEQTETVRFYHDADVLAWPILGFQNFESYLGEPTQKLLLVRALLSAGYLGTAYVLRPHALELDNLIRRAPSFSAPKARIGFSERVYTFLRSEGIEAEMTHLLDIVNSDLDEGLKIQQFLKELQSVGAETFVAIELANGSWQERLKRLHSTVLGFEKIGSHMDDILKERVVWRFNKVLSEQIGSRQLSLSNLRDASALAVLHGMIGARNLGRDVPIVRFYTDTDRLIHAWSTNDKMRHDLSYSNNVVSFQKDKDFIFRDTDYFVLRASFEALRFKGVNRRRRQMSVTLTELDRVSRELDKALVDPSVDLIKKVEQIRVCDRILVEVIAEIETLSFLRSVWSQYKPPKALKSMISGLADVWAFADDQMTQGCLYSDIRRDVDILKRELGEKVSHIRSWYTLFREVQNRASGIRGRYEEHGLPDPMRDFGMIRWGFELSEETAERIQDYFEALSSVDDDEWVRGCADFVSEVEGVDDNSSCTVVCSILWLLTLFERLVEVINDYEDMTGKVAVSPSFFMMRNAARLRTKSSFSRIEKEEQIADLAAHLHNLVDMERGRLLIGLGYNCFYVWHSERDRFPALEPSIEGKEIGLSWAERSFSFGEEAVGLLKKDDPLGYAFAINHCAFVGVMTGVKHELTRIYLDRLAELRGEKGVWHYRFADTLAYSDHLEAEKLWETIRGQESSRDIEKLRKRACRMLDSADRFLREAGPYYNDPEIPQHRLQIERLKRNINCPD